MWIPKKIILQNFKSFISQEYDFQKGAFLIQGINKTDDGAISNGSGKSSLQHALCYCLGLSIYTSINTDLINNNADSCTVTFNLRNEKLNQDLNISRTTPKKGSGLLTIILNGLNQADKFSTVLEGNKLIIDLLGISKEDLLNHYIISKENFTSFFDSPDSKVKELIGRFSNFNRINGVEDIVQKDLGKLNSNLFTLNSENDKLKGRVEILKEQLENEKNFNIEQIKDKKINDLESSIGRYEFEINNSKNAILENNKIIDSLKAELNIENSLLSSLEQEIIELKDVSFDKEIEAFKNDKNKYLKTKAILYKENSEIQEQIKEFIKFKHEIENSIAGSIQCPKCLHDFIPNSDIDVDETKNVLPEVLNSIDELQRDLIEKDNKIIKIEKGIENINEIINNYEKKITDSNNLKLRLIKNKNSKQDSLNIIERKISSITNGVNSYKDRIKGFEASIKLALEQIEIIKSEVIISREKEIKENIEKNDDFIKSNETEIQQAKDEMFHVEQWIFRFKKFKSYLANESLNIIQGYSNMYLQKMKTNLSIILEGYKILKSGEIRDKITPVILRNGEQEGSGNYRKYSGGERCKIDFSIIMALQSLVNNSCKTGGLNLIFVDEVLSPLDSLGLENLAESVNDFENYILIVSHTTHEKIYQNILAIEKNNGISKILNN